jgi:hypothetical protein
MAKNTAKTRKTIALAVSVAMAINISATAFAASVVDIDTDNATYYEDGQLQSAVNDAQSRGEDGNVHTVTLTTDETVNSALEITDSIVIDLNGNQLELADDVQDSLIKIEATDAIDVTITSSAEQRGELSGGAGSEMDFSDLGDTDYYGTYGGAIQITDRNTSDTGTQITIENVTITGNTADFGGGIYATSTTSESSKNGTITISNSDISGNTANEMGGAVEIVGFETVQISNTTVTDNVTGSADSFSYGSGGSLVLDVIQNATIADSTISGNTAEGIYSWGGGIYTEDSSVTITNTTISDNQAAWGGGILGVRSDIELSGTTTVANNTAASAGDDIYFMVMAGGFSHSSLTLNTASGTLNADGKAIDGWYVDGVQDDATLRWSETGEGFEDGYYATQAPATLDITGNLALKAAHGPADSTDEAEEDEDEDENGNNGEGDNENGNNGETDEKPTASDPVTTPSATTPAAPVEIETTPTAPKTELTVSFTSPVQTPEATVSAEEELVEIEENEIPLADAEEIEEEDVPLTELPEEEVPLSGAPRTGDTTLVWALTALAATLGLTVSKRRSKRA